MAANPPGLYDDDDERTIRKINQAVKQQYEHPGYFFGDLAGNLSGSGSFAHGRILSITETPGGAPPAAAETCAVADPNSLGLT